MGRTPHSERKRYESGYGGFPGGDPREFSPDPECSTDAERAEHERACLLFADGGCSPLAGAHRITDVAEARAAVDEGRAMSAMIAGDVALVSYNGFGLGSYRFRVPIISRRQRRAEHKAWLAQHAHWRYGDLPTFAECERAAP